VELVRIVLLGEGMIEARADGALAYGGDVVNTAVYLARLGAKPVLLSALGTDADSDALAAAWRHEGIDVRRVLRDPVRRAGRYAVQLDDQGERRFTYDRDSSAARAFFTLPGAEAALAWAAHADLLYLSGITLAVCDAPGRARIGALAAAVRKRGGVVAFDPNHRPALWPSSEAAWAAIEALMPSVTIAMPSSEDHARLRGPAAPAAIAAAWLALGAEEVVVKLGAEGALAVRRGETARIAAPRVPVVDTTGAGDAFNAAYLHARLRRGATLEAALAAGAALAAEVVGWPGAIAPRPVGVVA